MLPGHAGQDGAPLWCGGGRLAAGLTLPRLRERSGHLLRRDPGRSAAFRFTAPERSAIYGQASRNAAVAAEHIRRCAHSDPLGAADAAWAAADTLHVAARALRSPALRCAADAYDRAARAPHGRVPRRTRDGDLLRTTARLVARLGYVTGDGTLAAAALIASLGVLAAAVSELRQAQQHSAQAAAARAASEHLRDAATRGWSPAPRLSQSHAAHRPRTAAGTGDFAPQLIGLKSATARQSQPSPRPDVRGGRLPPRRAGPIP
jgi:hypothetical protein